MISTCDPLCHVLIVISVSVFLPPSLPEARLINIRAQIGVIDGGIYSGFLLPGEDVRSVRLRYFANTAVNRGHSRGCPAYIESESASLNTTGVTRQQYGTCLLRVAVYQLRSDVSSCGLLAAGLRCGMSIGVGMPVRAAPEQFL